MRDIVPVGLKTGYDRPRRKSSSRSEANAPNTGDRNDNDQSGHFARDLCLKSESRRHCRDLSYIARS